MGCGSSKGQAIVPQKLPPEMKQKSAKSSAKGPLDEEELKQIGGGLIAPQIVIREATKLV
jgi:hypothetical protein